jgi:hypothetical protein
MQVSYVVGYQYSRRRRKRWRRRCESCYEETFRIRNQDSSKCAYRDADKLERLLKVKERQKEETMHMEDTQKLVTEIEMLRIVLYLVNMNRNITQHQDRRMRRNS